MKTSTNTSFDFNSIPAEKPASWKQIKSRVGNPATTYLFNELGLKGDQRETYKATNRKLFNQMASALKTATLKNPLNNGDIRAIDKSITKAHQDIFNQAFKELYLEPNALGVLLLSDGLSAKAAQLAVTKYCEITGKKKATTKAKAKVTTRAKVKSDKPLKVSVLTDDQRADAIAILQQRLDALIAA